MKKQPFETKIGILGAGQLGSMLMEAGLPWNITYHTLDAADAPGRHISHHHIVGTLYEEECIKKLAGGVDILTFEIEHLDAAMLSQVNIPVIPFPTALVIIQDKGLQKLHYHDYEIPSAPFALVESIEEWKMAARNLSVNGQVVAKSRTGGYDGKGVKMVSADWIEEGNIPFDGPSLLEMPIHITKELSVLVTIDKHGNKAVYEAVEMVFDPALNLVDTLIFPANIPTEVHQTAQELAIRTANSFKSPGLFAIEMFMDEHGKIWVNETAPRPHNSGHHTIESCVCSQYQQLNRILTGLPLGSTRRLHFAAMINLIGPEGIWGTYPTSFANDLLGIEGIFVHLYGKTETRPGRKMGHITFIADNHEHLNQRILSVKEILSKYR